MKKEDIPQDKGALGKFTREVSYAVDEQGNYITGLSEGWDVKIKALDVAWRDIEQKVNNARIKVQHHEASPILYYMELKLMNLQVLSDYTGFWQWQIKRHLKPKIFEKLSDKKLQRYANVFEVSVDDLKNVNWNEPGV